MAGATWLHALVVKVLLDFAGHLGRAQRAAAASLVAPLVGASRGRLGQCRFELRLLPTQHTADAKQAGGELPVPQLHHRTRALAASDGHSSFQQHLVGDLDELRLDRRRRRRRGRAPRGGRGGRGGASAGGRRGGGSRTVGEGRERRRGGGRQHNVKVSEEHLAWQRPRRVAAHRVRKRVALERGEGRIGGEVLYKWVAAARVQPEQRAGGIKQVCDILVGDGGGGRVLLEPDGWEGQRDGAVPAEDRCEIVLQPLEGDHP